MDLNFPDYNSRLTLFSHKTYFDGLRLKKPKIKLKIKTQNAKSGLWNRIDLLLMSVMKKQACRISLFQDFLELIQVILLLRVGCFKSRWFLFISYNADSNQPANIKLLSWFLLAFENVFSLETFIVTDSIITTLSYMTSEKQVFQEISDFKSCSRGKGSSWISVYIWLKINISYSFVEI